MTIEHPGKRVGLARRILKNAGTSLMGNVIATVINFASLIVTARLLTPYEFGNLILFSVAAQIITMLLGFESWQAVVRFGEETRGTPRDHALIITSGALLDIGAAIVSCAAYLVLIPIFVHLRSPSMTTIVIACIFSVTIITSIVGTPSAILRLYGRYEAIAWRDAAGALLKLILLLPGLLIETTPLAVAAIWVASQTLGQLFLMYLAASEMRRQGIGLSGIRQSLHFLDQHRQILKFFVLSNLDSTVRAVRDFDILIVGLSISPTAAGFFRIARQFGTAAGKPVDAMYFALFPEMAALAQRRDYPMLTQVVKRASLLIALIGTLGCAALTLFGREFISTFLSARYAPAFTVCVLVSYGQLVWAIGQPMVPAYFSLDRQKRLVAIQIATTSAYMIMVVAVGYWFGLTGIGVCFLSLHLLRVGLLFGGFPKALSRARESGTITISAMKSTRTP